MPSLRYIIQQLLVEGRLEDAQKKYPKVDVNALAADDPSGRAAKYLMWMAKQVDAGASTVDVISTVQAFHSNPQKFQYQDINRYTAKQLEDEWKELEATTDKFGLVSASELRRLAKSGAIEIYRDDEHIVHRIRDKAAAQAYGKGTKWCITMSNGTYFDSYDNQNVVFYFAVRLKPLGDDMDKIAYAILRSSMSNTITGTEVYDAADNKIWGLDPDTDDVSTSPFDRPELLRDVEDAIYNDLGTVPKSFGADVRSGTVTSERIKEEFKKCTDAKSQLSFLCMYKLSDELYATLLPTIVDDEIHAIVNDLISGRAESDGRSHITYRGDLGWGPRRNGGYHRLDGPAFISQNGHMEWWVNGLRHREDGPAIVYADGNKEWYINGKLHRLDGPAIHWKNAQHWFVNGKRHRLDGPAVIIANKPDASQWWVNGVRCYNDGHTIGNSNSYADAVVRYNAEHAT